MSLFEKATQAWGNAMPSWIEVLARACDASSLRKVAAKLGASPAILSLAISNKRTKLDFIRKKVEGMLMVTSVLCPVLGDISMQACLDEQVKPFSSANPTSVQRYKACHNGCKHYKHYAKEQV